MESIARRHGPGEAAVAALEAGADLVLMPAEPFTAIDAVVAAVRQGRISHADLLARLERRHDALSRLPAADAEPTSRSPAAPLGALGDGVRREDLRLAEELVRSSLQLRGGPVRPPATVAGGDANAGGLSLVRVDAALASPFLSGGTAPALTWPATAGFRAVLIDGQGPSAWDHRRSDAPLALERLGDGPVLLQLFVRGNPFRGSAGGGEEPWPAAIRQLQRSGRLAGLIVYGSPYLWETLLPVLAADIPAAWSPGQMPLAQGETLARLGLGAVAAAFRTGTKSSGTEFTD
jgi:beta-glucosidase